MATAGYGSKIRHSTTLGGTYTDIAGMNTSGIDFTGKELDTSSFGTGWETFIYGPNGAGLPLEGDYDKASTQQEALRNAWLNRTNVFLEVLADGTNGWKGEFLITSWSVKTSFGDKATFSATAKLTGAPTAVP